MLYGFIFLIIGSILFITGLRLLKIKYLIENIPTSKIRSIAMGLVEIYGSVVKWKKLLKSPLSGKKCVYYKYTIQEYIYSTDREGNYNGYWETIKESEDRTLFYLKDNTGKVLVDPEGAHIEISPDFSSKTKIPKPIQSFLKTNKINPSKRIWIKEYLIKPNNKLYILGNAVDNPFVKEGTSVQGAEDIMIEKGKHEIYYISDKPENEILGNLKLKMLGCLLFGGAMIIFGLYSIFIE